MSDKTLSKEDVEVTSCHQVYWASTDQYIVEVDGVEHTIRYAEDSNGGEMLYLSEEGWDSIWSYDDIPAVAAIIEAWEDGELELGCY